MIAIPYHYISIYDNFLRNISIIIKKRFLSLSFLLDEENFDWHRALDNNNGKKKLKLRKKSFKYKRKHHHPLQRDEELPFIIFFSFLYLN